MKARGVFYFGKFIVMGVAFLALFTCVVMLLWNWLLLILIILRVLV